MKIKLIVVGKTSFNYIREGIKDYEERLKRYMRFEIEVIPDLKNSKNMPKEKIKILEGSQILSRTNKDDFIILLDEKGKTFSSESFAKFINEKINHSISLTFITGGAYGFSEEVYRSANFKISLSEMTFSHQICRLIFLEQLYRSFTIINNEPYHHA